MRHSRSLVVVVAAVSLVAACNAQDDGTGPSSAEASVAAAGIESGPLWTIAIPNAVTVNLAVAESEAPLLGWVGPGVVMTARIDAASGAFRDIAQVNGAVDPITHPIERPAVLVRDDGGFEVAFTSFQGSGATVFRSVAGAEPKSFSGDPVPETNLVHVTPASDGSPVYAWLEASTLSIGVGGRAGVVETPLVDDSTCDCCNPAPLFAGSNLVVAYRDLETIDGMVARDVVATVSTDGGGSHVAPLAIADEHWFIDGCPFSGPSAVVAGDTLVVSWDARQSVHPEQRSTTIWVDRSIDEGASFGHDIAVTDGGVHSWPVMAVDGEGAIHLMWETQGDEGGLSYARSEDQGASFTEPVLLVTRGEGDHGAPRSPSLAHHHGMLIATWTDSAQGHVAAWGLD